MASAILALLFCLILWLAEDTNLRHWLEDFTSSAKQGLEAVQIPENFAACLISSNPNDGLALLLCGHGAWVSEHLTRSGIVMIVLGTPGALIYALLAGFASGIPGTIFSVLLIVWFVVLFKSWLNQPEQNPLELVMNLVFSFLAVWLLKLLVVNLLAGFGWLVQFIGLSAAFLLGFAKVLEVFRFALKAHEVVTEP